MSIAVRCLKCGKNHHVQDKLAGKKAKCPCGQILIIPFLESNLSGLLDEELSLPDKTDFGEMALPDVTPPKYMVRKRKQNTTILWRFVVLITCMILGVGILTGVAFHYLREINYKKYLIGSNDILDRSAAHEEREETFTDNYPNGVPHDTLLGKQNFPAVRIAWPFQIAGLPIPTERAVLSPPWSAVKPFGPGHETPEEAFEAVRKAGKNRDNAAIVDSFCPSTICSQYFHAAGNWIHLPPEYAREIGKKYNTNEKISVRGRPNEISWILYEAVPEKRSLIIDVMNAWENSRNLRFLSSTLNNARMVDITDDKYLTRVTYMYHEGNKECYRIMYLQQYEGRWYLWCPPL